ncbi:MAG: hypothetical protein LC687_04775 [Actinobacteria bacterium]|nr:hypothetical protein [Actinomycetota bacterium]
MNKTEAMMRIWDRDLTRMSYSVLEGNVVGKDQEGNEFHVISMFEITELEELETMIWLSMGRKFYPSMARDWVALIDQISPDWAYIEKSHRSMAHAGHADIDTPEQISKGFAKIRRKAEKLRKALAVMDGEA